MRLANKFFYRKKNNDAKFDGCAISFNRQKFALTKRFYLNMNLGVSRTAQTNALLSEEMTYPGVAQFIVLRDLQQAELGYDNNILVVNTHILFNMVRGDLKLAMLALIMKTVLKANQAFDISDIFMCGDFNLIPNSMLYKWISSNEIDLNADLREFSNQNMISRMKDDLDIEELIKLGDRKFKSNDYSPTTKQKVSPQFLRALVKAEIRLPESNSDSEEILVTESFVGIFEGDDHTQFLENLSKLISFKSAYAEFNRKYYKRFVNRSEVNALNFFFNPKFNNNDSFVTQYTHNFKNTVDYIWYSANGKYQIGRVLQTPDPRVLFKNSLSFPFQEFGSDHFSLAADFYFRP
jgi:mRNA deadenylase 3'-5' endonuclease subunit Ccr4